ncbi:MAG: hypothetical protein ACYS6W_12870 [Planctomycetota bacterium]|jgi:hypothetical protein
MIDLSPTTDDVLQSVDNLIDYVSRSTNDDGWIEIAEQQAELARNNLQEMTGSERASCIGAIRQKLNGHSGCDAILTMLQIELPKRNFETIKARVAMLKEQQTLSLANPATMPPPEHWVDGVKDILKDCGQLDENELEIVLQMVEKGPKPLAIKCRTDLKRIWRAAQRTEGKKILSGQAIVGRPERPESWPYEVKGGGIIFMSEKVLYDSITIQTVPVADFQAKITKEITSEGGEKIFVISGNAIRNGPFEIEIEAEEFGSDHRLKAKMEAASGALDPVRAGMGKHLCAAIKKLSKHTLQITRYKRTGWAGEKFLLPGRELDNIEIRLSRKMAYSIDPDADLTMGLEALESLILSMGAERSTPVLSSVFQAPIMRPAGWENERYAMFIAGRTGSLKTSFIQASLCIYGSRFIDDVNLIKWGEGATRTSVMLYAAMAQDMPFLIDNYKPNTGRGSSDFVNLVHNIVEGGDKDRANRNAELRETKPLFCLPVCTGEDVPGNDPASLSRILVMTFAFNHGETNPHLTKAQEFHNHLPAIGGVWLDWIESDEGRQAIAEISAKFPDYRAKWIDQLNEIRTDSVNKLRVSSNLATNQLTWELLTRHPDIGPLAKKYQQAHTDGLTNIVAVAMAEATAEALEATRFINALRELYATERVMVLPVVTPELQTEMEKLDIERQKDRIIGWFDDKGVYLLPSTARQAAERLLGPGSLNGISNTAICKQLDEHGLICSQGKNRYDKNKRIGDKFKTIIHLKPDVMTAENDLPVTKQPNPADDIPF